LAEKKKVSTPLWSVMWRSVKIVVPIMPVFWFLTQLVAIIHGVSYGFRTFATQGFYDSVENVITHGEPVSKAILMILALGGIMIARELLNGIHNFMHSVNFAKQAPAVKKLIHEKAARIEPICFEDTNVQDDINKAIEGSGTALHMVNIGVTIVTFYLPYFVFMAFYLRHLKPALIFAVLAVFLPILLGQIIKTSISAKFEDEAAPVRREYDYYHETISGREYFKETRLLGAFGFFIKRLTDAMSRLAKAETKQARHTALLDFTTQMLSAVGYIVILVLLVSALLSGEISIGAFAAVFGSIDLMFSIMHEMITGHIGNMASGLGKARNFIRFLDLPERGGTDAVPDVSCGITMENVSFAYPNTEHNSVDGVSLTIKAGETVAIVGKNGAGKSTLVRLLLGLYKPSGGTVKLCGMDTADTNAKSLFGVTSAVFQKFRKYQMTLKENVNISDSGNSDDITDALIRADVDAKSASFPDGADTMLSREFEGVDLSGGEWQRVAIARGLYRGHSVIALDEPTAAIDPIEESRVYRRFADISREKTAIIVTHRLGSVKIADRVIVMDNGKIVGSGSHDELLINCDLYRDMWNAQARWYELTSP
jgi:ATP-binding cassette subfamily B protein